jgi:hypothetical protein
MSTFRKQDGIAASFPHRGQHNGSLPSANVAFQVKDLLPGSENKLAICDRYTQRWTEQGCLQMGMPVAVVPSPLVAITAAGWNQLVQNRRQVSLQSRLELNRSDGGRAPDIEHVDDSSLDAGRVHHVVDFIRNVVHVSVTFGSYGNLFLINHLSSDLLQVARATPMLRKTKQSNKPGYRVSMLRLSAIFAA